MALTEIDALNLLMVPGVTTVPVINAGIAYAEGRKDLLFIADTPMYLEPLETVDFRKGQGMYSHAAFNSSYAALYYPWLEISDPVNSRKKLVPPCGAVAGCIARSDQKTNVWNAPRGIDRGASSTRSPWLQDQPWRARCALSGRGQRHRRVPRHRHQHLGPEDAAKPALGRGPHQRPPSDDVHGGSHLGILPLRGVRAEPSPDLACPRPPDQPLLQDIKDKGGLYDFAFQCDEETNTPAVIDRNEMVARVFVKPTKTAEFIELNFILTATSADFKEII